MRIWTLALVLPGLAACAQPEPPRPALTEAPTHARYTAALSEFGLDKTALGQDWLMAADRALAEPVPATLPFSETGYLTPESPIALGYQFDLERGRRLVVDVEFQSSGSARLFVDLFEAPDGREPRLVASVPPEARQLDYEARRTGAYVLRVQPELLRGGRFTIAERTRASLGFPVEGLSARAIQSVFGAPRDGGRRDHHGVDIFAARGTPVLAAVDGRVRTDVGNRGGNVIWLTPTDGSRRRLYYAHLHDWAVENGAEVKAGEVIGFVGNTGNARTTPPHLHFGVYDRGPVDPYAYISPDDHDPPAIRGAADVLRGWVRVNVAEAPLRRAPSSRAEIGARLDRNLVARVLAASGGFYRVGLPDGSTGYVPIGQVTAASDPLATIEMTLPGQLRDRPNARAAVVGPVAADTVLDVLGTFGDYRLVRLPDARIGWLPTATAVE